MCHNFLSQNKQEDVVLSPDRIPTLDAWLLEFALDPRLELIWLDVKVTREDMMPLFVYQLKKLLVRHGLGGASQGKCPRPMSCSSTFYFSKFIRGPLHTSKHLPGIQHFQGFLLSLFRF